MKIILSHKGFDSANGGCASPILPDGRLISLPIPKPIDSDAYSELKFDSSILKDIGLVSEICSYYDLMTELRIRHIKTKCHLDPDIRKEVLDEERKAIFGQCGIAQNHLRNEKVDMGDLFLFFGRFQQTKIDNGKLIFNRQEPVLHIIFGYLQVEEIIRIEKATEKQKEWMKSQRHPHIKYTKEKCKEKCKRKCNNTIYVARESLSLNGLNVPGSGVLNISEDGVLTHRNLEKSIQSCSKWFLPKMFKEKYLKGEIKMSYNKNRWNEKEGYFKSTAPGQEFVIETYNDEAENYMKEWAKNIISEGIKTARYCISG